MKKRILLVLFALTLAFSLTACGFRTDTGTNQSPATQPENTVTDPAPQPSTPAETQQTDPPKITEEQAKKIAFDHAGVSADNVYGLELELDRDDGVLSYEIEFRSDRTEYKYDIHAETGTILETEKDYDD